jgi:hypothetical protein
MIGDGMPCCHDGATSVEGYFDGGLEELISSCRRSKLCRPTRMSPVRGLSNSADEGHDDGHRQRQNEHPQQLPAAHAVTHDHAGQHRDENEHQPHRGGDPVFFRGEALLGPIPQLMESLHKDGGDRIRALLNEGDSLLLHVPQDLIGANQRSAQRRFIQVLFGEIRAIGQILAQLTENFSTKGLGKHLGAKVNRGNRVGTRPR